MNSDGTNYKQVANILFGYSYEQGGHNHENGYITRMNGTTGAIFIPCRGGGTATTYYTDWHDVDEDRTTICNYGGWWHDNTLVGATYRTLYDSPTTTLDDAASRLIYLS